MDKSAKTKAAVSAVAAVTAASVLVGGAFSSPADILDDGPDGHVLAVDMGLESQTDAGDDSGDGAGDEEESRGRLTASLRKLLRQTPAGVRALMALPLWLMGTLLIEAGAALWGAVLSPAAAVVLNWAAVALVVLAVFLLAARTVAPELPIKKILNRRSVSGVFILCAFFGLADVFLPLFWDGYEGFEKWLRAVGSCVCAAVPLAFFLRWNGRRLVKKEQEAGAVEELSYEERERAARLLIEELADSVSRPRY